MLDSRRCMRKLINKSLSISVETIRHLSAEQLRAIAGGISGDRDCNYTQYQCKLSGLRYGCESGPETDTGTYPSLGC